MLGKLPVPGRPTNMDYSRARDCCACSRCGWGGCFDIFSLLYHFSPLSPSLWEMARYRLKYCLKGPLSPKQPSNRIIPLFRQARRPHTWEMASHLAVADDVLSDAYFFVFSFPT